MQTTKLNSGNDTRPQAAETHSPHGPLAPLRPGLAAIYAGAVLLLLWGSAALTVAQVVQIKEGRITVTLTLDPGTGTLPSDFPINPSSTTARVSPPVGGDVSLTGEGAPSTDNMTASSPPVGNLPYPYTGCSWDLPTPPITPVCLPSSILTYPLLAPLTSYGTYMPAAYNEAEFSINTVATGDNTATAYTCDYAIPYWVDMRVDLPGPMPRQHYYARSFRSHALVPFNVSDAAATTESHAITEDVGAIRVLLPICNGIPAMNLSVSGSPYIMATIASNPDPETCAPTYRGLNGRVQNVPGPKVPGDTGTVQASVDAPPNNGPVQEEVFLVRAGHTYEVTMRFRSGDDPFADQLVGEAKATTALVQQGTIVDLQFPELDRQWCDDGNACVSAVGCLQMWDFASGGPKDIFLPGGAADPLALRPAVVIYQGPYGNIRYAHIDPPTSGSVQYSTVPSDVCRLRQAKAATTYPDANFLLQTVFVEAHPDGIYGEYNPQAVLYFETASGLEYMDTPDGSPKRRFTCSVLSNPAAHCTDANPLPNGLDLGNLLKLRPGFVKGDIHLKGPNCGEPTTCLEWITHKDTTQPLDYRPSYFWLAPADAHPNIVGWLPISHARGDGGRSTGTDISNGGGFAVATIEKVPSSSTPIAWNGSYDLWLAGLSETDSFWDPRELKLWFKDPTSGNETVPPGWVSVKDVLADNNWGNGGSPGAELEVVQNTPYVNNHNYCFGERKLHFVNPDGAFITDPSVECGGSFDGLDPWDSSGNAKYTAQAKFYGPPTYAPNQTYVTGSAHMRYAVPAGNYVLTPRIWIKDSNGNPQLSTLFPFAVTIGCECGEDFVSPKGGPAISLTDPPPCTADAAYVLQGTVQPAPGHALTAVSYTINGGFPNPLCSGAACGGVGVAYDLSTAPIILGPCDNVITISATDDQGLTTPSLPFTIRLDTTPPVITGVPAATTVECNAVPPGSATLPAHDTCDAGVTVATLNADVIVLGNCPGRYTITRTWTATDACNKSTTEAQIIHVVDTTPPVLTCADITNDCTSAAGAVLNAYPVPTASDLCSGPVTFTYDTALPHTFPLGVTPVLCTATDACGNSRTCTFRVIVLAHGSDRWAWARQAGNWNGDPVQPAIGNGVAVDKWGNVFVTGM